MNLDDVNKDPALKRTPIGALRVARAGRDLVVQCDHGRGRWSDIHIVARGGNVFDALYGKVIIGADVIRAAYQRRDEDREAAYAEGLEREEHEIAARMRKIWARDSDGAQWAFRTLFGGPR